MAAYLLLEKLVEAEGITVTPEEAKAEGTNAGALARRRALDRLVEIATQPAEPEAVEAEAEQPEREGGEEQPEQEGGAPSEDTVSEA